MKQLTFFLLLMISFAVQAQEENTKQGKLSKSTEIGEIAVFPNCDKDPNYKTTKEQSDKNKALTKCFAKNITPLIHEQLEIDELNEIAERKKLTILKSYVTFKITKNGLIENSKTQSSIPKMEKMVNRVINRIAKKLNSENKIISAKDVYGNSIESEIKLPIFYVP